MSRIRPHENKRHLTKKEQEELEEWMRTTEDMYECGHRYGVIVELSPHDIAHIGHLVGRIFEELKGAFEVFPKVGGWHEYDMLLIPPDEAALWLLEVEELQSAIVGVGSLPREKVEQLIMQVYLDELRFELGSWPPNAEVDAKVDFARAVWLQEGYGHQTPEAESTIEMMQRALDGAARLCQASIQTGNPIKMVL